MATTNTFIYRGDLPEKISVRHQLYAEDLLHRLKERVEMILDFDALQTSVDPTLDSAVLTTTGDENSHEEKFDYKHFMTSYFSGTDILPSLQTFKLRGFARAGPKFPLMEGIKQMDLISELDLSNNDLSGSLQDQLQLWSLVELKTLKLDKTHLTQVPPSIGRLRKLEYLSLSDNSLTSLPLTLGFCQNLKYLNLVKNKFRTLPGVVLQLKKLEDLKRWDNNLEKRFNGYEAWPHIQSVANTKKTSNNPDSLTALSCRAIMTTHIDYWSEENLPPLQCKMLDSFATQYQYCQNCHQSNCSQMIEIKVLILKFVGLTDVPISLHSCQNCKDILIKQYRDMQSTIKCQMDEDYEKDMREAERAFNKGEIGELVTAVPEEDIQHFVNHWPRGRQQQNRRRRLRRNCSIM